MSNKLSKKAGPLHLLADLQDIRVLIVAKTLQANDTSKKQNTSYLDLAYLAVDALIAEGFLTSRDEFIVEIPVIKE